MALGGLSESYAFDGPTGTGKQMNQARARKWFRHFVTDGIVNEQAEGLEYTNPLNVTLGTWPSVNVASGECIIRGFYGRQSGSQTGSHQGSNASLPRKARVVLRLDLATKRIETAIVEGGAAASPTLPALTQSSTIWEIPLATLDIAANATTATLTDERVFSVPTHGKGGLLQPLARSTAAQTGITTTRTDLTGLTVTASIPPYRRVRVHGGVHYLCLITADAVELSLREGSTAHDVRVNAFDGPDGGPFWIGIDSSAYTLANNTAAAVKRTFKLSLRKGVGSGTSLSTYMNFNALSNTWEDGIDARGYLAVEDAGPMREA